MAEQRRRLTRLVFLDNGREKDAGSTQEAPRRLLYALLCSLRQADPGEDGGLAHKANNCWTLALFLFYCVSLREDDAGTLDNGGGGG